MAAAAYEHLMLEGIPGDFGRHRRTEPGRIGPAVWRFAALRGASLAPWPEVPPETIMKTWSPTSPPCIDLLIYLGRGKT